VKTGKDLSDAELQDFFREAETMTYFIFTFEVMLRYFAVNSDHIPM
jgi:hypothetical protein